MKRFKQLAKTGVLYSSMACMMLLVACHEKDLYVEPEQPSPGEYFDFATTATYNLDINYRLTNYAVSFELYAENPLTEVDGSYEKATNITPIYKAATDLNGRLKTKIALPLIVDKLYLYSDYIGVNRCVELPVSGTSVAYDAEALKSKAFTGASLRSSHAYPEGYLVLGDWDDKGEPDYLNGYFDLSDLATGVAARLTHSMVKGLTQDKSFVDAHPGGDIKITSPTAISCVLLYSKASKGQPLCYYTYPTDTPPASPADIINPVLAYPGAQTSNFNGQMGHDLVLKYWNEETGEFEDEFPAGVSIGMFFLQEGLDNKGNVVINTDNQLEGQKLSEKTDMIFYANGDMNQKLPNNADAQRAITMYDGDQFVALCFESEIKHEAFKNGSWDYTDIIMGLYCHEAGSFDTNLPRLPEEKEEPTDETNVVEYWGTLAFEDNWPYKHDYDMNDVVIYYKSRVYKSVSSNEVVKIEDEFAVAHDGATFINGFGYQFAQLSNSQVTNVSVETQSGLSSTYANGLEADQNHPTILLYDNNKVASEMNATFKVTTTFASGVSEASVIPPYNPFIFIQSNSGRGRELHLVNNTPTAKMDEKLFQTADDESQPNSGLFYVSDNNLPFAIHLSHTYFEWPNESKIITSYYPQFADWAKSKGSQNNRWYLSPEK